MDAHAWMSLLPPVDPFDAHTHIGANDPDGMRQSPAELRTRLQAAGAVGAFVFPMHEPDGYPPANDAVLAAFPGRPDSGLRLVPFCRVNPHDGAVAEARRCLALGARGIKLHPRAERFTLDHPAVRELFALADERSLPILVHAGRGIPALGAHLVQRCREFPRARAILAHAGITDLSWIWRAAVDLPNLLFDSSWFMPADLRALLSLIPPGQILWASDAPYGNPLIGRIVQHRLMLQLGLSDGQIAVIFAEQALRVAASEPLIQAGGPLGEPERPTHLLLDRIATFVLNGMILTMRGQAPEGAAEQLALARLACEVPEGIDHAPVFAAIAALLDEYAEDPAMPEHREPLALLMLALSVAATPDVPVPPAP
jgi:predicted TIM-barrel fold metal-dependent hydrolase